MSTTAAASASPAPRTARSGGFTLLEVMVALAIFGLLAAAGVGVMAGSGIMVIVGEGRSNMPEHPLTKVEHTNTKRQNTRNNLSRVIASIR